MGMCASTGELDQEAQPDETKQKTPRSAKQSADIDINNVQVQVADEKLSPESEDDFRLVIKEVTIMALEQLCRALEYEKEGYLEVAQKQKKDGYMAIMSPESFKSALSSILEVGTPEASALASSDVNFEQDNYLLFLKACRAANYKDTTIDRQALSDLLQKAARDTQRSLQASAEVADASDLKLHLYFFVNCLNILQGELVSKPGTLFKNIQTFSSGEPVGKSSGIPKGV